MITNLFFVRHAHSAYSPDERERPLSEKGKKDAERVTQLLRDVRIDHVLASPYKRAIQTVEGVASVTGKTILIEEDFKERQLAEGPVENFDAAIQKVWENPSFSWKGGESNLIAQQRGVRAVLKLLDTYEGKNLVIGTHGNIMVLIINYFDETYGYEFWQKLDMPDIYRLTFNGKQLLEITHHWQRV
jgi:2,3-bisphosphoglycerate-dependent phosphoglycerate mutase